MVQTHWNSPAIMMWDIFNEGQGQQNTGGGVGQTNTAYLVQLDKTLDPSRLELATLTCTRPTRPPCG